MRRAGLALIATAIVLAALPPLLRSGALDFTERPGMVDRPCQVAAARLARRGVMVRGSSERRRVVDWAGLCHFRAENEKLVASGVRPRAVMIGDSTTAFWGLADPRFLFEE